LQYKWIKASPKAEIAFPPISGRNRLPDTSRTWSTLVLTLWQPWALMLETLTFIPQTVLKALRQGHDLSVLASWHAFQNAWFADVWAVLGPWFAEGGAPVVEGVLQRVLRAADRLMSLIVKALLNYLSTWVTSDYL
jgi:hypothetical protein